MFVKVQPTCKQSDYVCKTAITYIASFTFSILNLLYPKISTTWSGKYRSTKQWNTTENRWIIASHVPNSIHITFPISEFHCPNIVGWLAAIEGCVVVWELVRSQWISGMINQKCRLNLWWTFVQNGWISLPNETSVHCGHWKYFDLWFGEVYTLSLAASESIMVLPVFWRCFAKQALIGIGEWVTSMPNNGFVK